MEFRIDSIGYPRARAEPGREELADYLEADIQGDPQDAERVLHWVRAVREGRAHKIEGSGNQYLLTLTRSSASIVTNLEEGVEPLVVPLDEFEEAVRGWLRCVLGTPD